MPILFCAQLQSSLTMYELRVMLHYFANPLGLLRDGTSCDIFFQDGKCDTTFFFCMRDFDSEENDIDLCPVENRHMIAEFPNHDVIDFRIFSDDNLLVFTGDTWQVSGHKCF